MQQLQAVLDLLAAAMAAGRACWLAPVDLERASPSTDSLGWAGARVARAWGDGEPAQSWLRAVLALIKRCKIRAGVGRGQDAAGGVMGKGLFEGRVGSPANWAMYVDGLIKRLRERLRAGVASAGRGRGRGGGVGGGGDANV